MDNLRIFLTEDREIIRRRITGFIEKISDMNVVGSATDGDAAGELDFCIFHMRETHA